MPSSLTVDLPSALVCSTRPRVSVCGTGAARICLAGFLGSLITGAIAFPRRGRRTVALRLKGRICLSLSAPFSCLGLDWNATVGATPWETSFYNGGSGGFAVSEVSLQAEKSIRITERFSLPLFAKVIWNPAMERGFFVAGMSF